MGTPIKNNSVAENVLNESVPDYEKAEMDLLKDALKRGYTGRFLFTTSLYKIQQTFKKGKNYSQALIWIRDFYHGYF